MRLACKLACVCVAVSSIAAPSGASAELYDWRYLMVDSSADVQPHVSIAVDVPREIYLVAYYDADGQDLKLAVRGWGGSTPCSPASAWQCWTVDAAGDVGRYNAIGLRSGEDGSELAISYYDATNGTLKVAFGFCDGSGCLFSPIEVDAGNPTSGDYRGLHTGVKISEADGVVHVAYQRYVESGDDALRYAHSLPTATGNCGGDYWSCSTILQGADMGEHASLDLDSSGGPSIGFYARGSGYPWVATYLGSGGDCGPGNAWTCRSAQTGGADTGRFMSLYLDDVGVPRVAFLNVTDETLVYAYPDPVDSLNDNNCGFSSVTLDWEWQCDAIDEVGVSIGEMGIAITGDGDGRPILAYQDASDPVGPAVLKVARPYAATDGGTAPNCGPAVAPFDGSWVCEVVDSAGSFDLQEAAAVAIATGSDDNPVIAYHELFTYPYPAEGRLKVVYQPGGPIFGDDFESGDLSGWDDAIGG